ncbi:hypothetical protein LguiA_003319 [Lonicera macranthoides]
MEKVCWSPLKLCSSSGSSRLREREIFRNVERFLIRVKNYVEALEGIASLPSNLSSSIMPLCCSTKCLSEEQYYKTMVSQLVKHERIETTVAKSRQRNERLDIYGHQSILAARDNFILVDLYFQLLLEFS